MTEHSEWPIEIVRSDKRHKSVSAELKEGILVVRAPDTMDDETLQPIITKLQKRLHKKVNQPPPTADDLEKRAQQLNKKYFHGRLRWESIRYVTNQNKRYGSCTPAKGTIRLNHRLADLPAWVRDYVLMHELSHLSEGNHGPKFWRLVKRYPLTERARGYLMALDMEEESSE
jgi:predicted metal-dependent hydrolase